MLRLTALRSSTSAVWLLHLALAWTLRADSAGGGSHQRTNSSGGCFELLQGGRLVSNSVGDFNGTSAVISLSFHSFTREGVLLYMAGLHGDYMGLFLREGRMNYFIFNPSRLDKSLGGIHFKTEAEIKENRDYQVEFSFNQARQYPAVRSREQYSTALRLNDATVQLVDFYIDDLQFETPVYFGGGPSGLDLHVLDFEGRLSDISINGRQLDFVEFNNRVKRCKPV